MKIPIYQVDAFAKAPFEGNPAAVCPLDGWLDDGLMQAIAAENNLSETAFIVREGEGYGIRWFTPEVEVDLCGHATLASAHVVFHELGSHADRVTFASRSGPLEVERRGDVMLLDLPALLVEPMEVPDELGGALGARPTESFRGRMDNVLVFEDEATIRTMQPDFPAVARFGGRAVIVTAPGDVVDFVSRFFAPNAGIDEDPVTGSAHATLVPFWAARLGRTTLSARQLSRRGGTLEGSLEGDRVVLSAATVLFMKGEIVLPQV